jgi:hypothetical protein
LPASPTSSGESVLVPIAPAVVSKPPPLGMSSLPDMTHAGVINPCKSRDSSTTDVSFTPKPDPSCPGAAPTARALSTRDAPTPQLPRLRNAFHLPILVIRSSLALRTTIQTTFSTRVLPPWPDVRHALTHSLCVLGTPRNDYSSCRDGPHAVFRLLQLKRSSYTPTRAPNPSIQQQAAFCQVTLLLAEHCQPS